MATLSTRFPTLMDAAIAYDPDKKGIANVAELLSQTNEMLADMPWAEANGPTGHTSVVRTGLPASTWRKLYEGVQPTKSSRAKITDAIGMLEQRSEVDKALAELNGMAADFMLDEARAHIEGMNQDMQSTVIYGDTAVNPERFTGLAARYNALSGFEAAQNVVNAGGTTNSDHSSMWLVVWGMNTVHGIFPKGSMAGLQRDDLGLGDAFDTASPAGRYRAYMEHFVWKAGLTVRDWRYVVRICNIEVSDLAGAGLGSATQASTSATNLVRCMIAALHRVPNLRMGRPVFYANRPTREALDKLAMEKSSGVAMLMDAAGQFSTAFRGVPIKTCDALLTTEAALA
jgi:hypothetical protein